MKKEIYCPGCRKVLEIEEGNSGRKAQCPFCESKFIIDFLTQSAARRVSKTKKQKKSHSLLYISAGLFLLTAGIILFLKSTKEPEENIETVSVRPRQTQAQKTEVVKPKVRSQGKKNLKDLADIGKKYIDGKNGFLIVTTNDLTHRLKSLQDFISHKKNSQGFRMFLATEDEFGNGVGQDKALIIREWMRHNYEGLGIRYAILIGDGHPETGDIPMVKCGGDHPSDYFYVDLSGDWDLDKDGRVASAGDYGKGGIDGIPEVYVGRIPYYGESSDYGKAQDTDIILNRSIRYDNEEDISWRYGFTQLQQWDMIPEEVFYERDVLEPYGINYFRDKCYQDTIGFPHFELHAEGSGMQHNIAKLHKLDLGYTRLGGHGNSTGMHGINSWQTRQFLNDKKPAVVNMGACSVGHIENQHNLAYTLLRYHAIATHGGTRSVTGFGGAYSKPYSARLLEDKNSTGQAWWEHFGGRFKNGRISATAFLINLYGDPTVVPFRTGLDLPYSFVAKPVKPYHKVAKSIEDIYSLPSHNLELSNHKKSSVQVSASSSEAWLTPEFNSLSLAPGETKNLKYSIIASQAEKLAPGVHQAEMILKDGKGYICKRLFYLEIADAKMLAYLPFDNAKGNFTDFFGSQAHFTTGQKEDNPLTEGVVGQAVDMSVYPLQGNLTSPNQGHFSLAFWLKRDDLKQRAHLFSMHRCFDVWAEQDNSLTVEIKEFDCWGKEKDAFQTAKKFNLTWERSKWTHLAFSFDQDKGELTVCQNARKIGSIKTKPYLTFAPRGYSIGKFKGAVDELTIYNKPLGDKDLKDNYLGCFIAKPFPVNHSKRVVPGDIKLDFGTSKRIKPEMVLIMERGTDKKFEIKADENGKWTAKNIGEYKTYDWKAVGKVGDKRVDGPVWSFSTSKNLIANGDFEKDELLWSGDAKIIHNLNQVLFDKGTLHIAHGGSATVQAADLIEPGLGYSLKFNARTAWKKLMHFEIFTKVKGEELILKKLSRYMYQDRRGKSVNLDFYSFKDSQYIGKPLFVRFSNDKNEGSEAFIDNVTFMAYTHKSENKKPEKSAEFARLKSQWQVFDNNQMIRLNDYFSDPEGQVLSYKKLSGPDWLRVRNGEIMTNYGASIENIGDNKVLLEVSDGQNASIQAEINIEVIAAKSINVGTRITVPGKRFIKEGTGYEEQADSLLAWKEADTQLKVPTKDIPKGIYEVTINYACDNGQKGSQLEIAFKDKILKHTVSGRDHWNPEDHVLGDFEIDGDFINIKCTRRSNAHIANVYSVSFVKVDAKRIILPAHQAVIDGPSIQMTGVLCTHFLNQKDSISWQIEKPVSGEYKMLLMAGSPDENTAKIQVNERLIEFKIPNTGNYRNLREIEVGKVRLEGSTNIKLTAVEMKDGLCDLSMIKLLPVTNQRPEFTSRPRNIVSMMSDNDSKMFDLMTISKDEKVHSLKFDALDLPSWITLSPKGKMIFNAEKKVIPAGYYYLKIGVTDSEGLRNELVSWVEVKESGILKLSSSDASLSGENIRMTGDLITHITHDQAAAAWSFKVEKSGVYDVFLIAGTPDENVGRVTINGQEKDFVINRTGGYRNLAEHKVGEFSLNMNELTKLTLSVVKRVDGLCDASHFLLVPKSSFSVKAN